MSLVRSLLVLGGFLSLPAGYLATRPVEVIIPDAAAPGDLASSAEVLLSWDSVSANLVARDPFRADRSPAMVPFNPLPAEQAYVEPPPPKPAISVSGIVWGAEPSAVIEGLPGIEGGQLMRVGDAVAGITLKRITESRVTLTGMDTTWTLSVRKPW